MEHDLPTASPIPDPEPQKSELFASYQAPAGGDLTPDNANNVLAEERWERVRGYGLHICSHNFLAPLGTYCELLSEPQISPLPNAPQHFLGLCNVRGNLVPVYQLESLFKLDYQHSSYAIIIGDPASSGAIMINEKPVLIDMAELSLYDDTTNQHNQLPERLQQITHKTYQQEYTQWYEINHIELFKLLSNAIYNAA